MNKILKSVYSEELGTWIAVSEKTKTNGKKSNCFIVNVFFGLGIFFGFNCLNGDAWSQSAPSPLPQTGGSDQATNQSGYVDDRFNRVIGYKATALGWGNLAEGEATSALGYSNQAHGNHSVAMGNSNHSYGFWGLSIGWGNISGWNDRVQLPEFKNFKKSNVTSESFTRTELVSRMIQKTHNQAVAMGNNNGAFGELSVAIGNRNLALNQASVALGRMNLAQGTSSVSIGNWNSAISNNSSAVGYGNVVSLGGTFSSAIGINNFISRSYSYTFGGENIIESEYSSSIGLQNNVRNSSNYSNAVGFNNTLSGRASNAIGLQNRVSSDFNIAIGIGNNISGLNSISIGNGSITNVAGKIININENSVIGESTISIGNNNRVTGNNIALIGNSINSTGVNNSVILGNGSRGISAVELGESIRVSFGSVTHGGIDIADGWSGKSSVNKGSVSIGSPGNERQIKFVATGEISLNSTDAVNGSQLYSSIQSIGKVPIIFIDDSNESIHRLPGSTLKIYGGASGGVSNNNIGVFKINDQLEIKLAQNISGISSLSTILGTRLNNEGFFVRDSGPSITSTGINAGSKTISNVLLSAYPNPTDAANVQFVKDQLEQLRNMGYEFRDGLGNSNRVPLGSSITFTWDPNISVLFSPNAVNLALNKTITGLQRVEFDNGTRLDSDKLFFSNNISFGKDGLNIGRLHFTVDGKITGVSNPDNDYEAANKLYVDNVIRTVEIGLNKLRNGGITFVANKNFFLSRLGDSIKIKGSDDNDDLSNEKFDSNNIMTWSENDAIRIGLKKDLKVSRLRTENPEGNYLELTPHSILYKGFDNNDLNPLVISFTKAGSYDIKGIDSNRIILNDNEIATLNDGLKLSGNVGVITPMKLNSTLKIQGGELNKNATEFDGGKNIITMVVNENQEAKYTVALKKSPEFESLSLLGSSSSNNSAKLSIKEGLKDKITATVNESNGIITVIGKEQLFKTELKHDGLSLHDDNGNSKLGIKVDGISGIESPGINKRRLTHTYKSGTDSVVTEQIATLNDGFLFSSNKGGKGTKLNSRVKIAGAEANTNWNDFDEGQNIMTKVETNDKGETVIRIAMRKDLKLKNGSFGGDGTTGELKLKDKEGNDGLTLNPDKILFNNITKLDKNGQFQKNGSAGISMTQNGKSDLVKEGPATRILITDSKGNSISEVATMNDGLKFGANSGDEVSNLLNSKVIVVGNIRNTDWTKFDEGKNIMTKVEQNNGNTDITIALKRDIELDTATFGHGSTTEQNGFKPKEGKDGRIKLVNKDGETTIQIDAGKTADTNGPSISINKPDTEEGTKLTSEGLEIRKQSHTTKDSDKSKTKTSKAFVSIAPEGSARIEQDASQTRTRLTLKSGEGDSSIVEEIATMNDGLRFKGDSEEAINKSLSSTLSIVGGETDATKLTSSKEDKNIGVIVEDVPSASKDTNTKSQKVLAVRLSKNLKGLQSAEFKPVDKNGKSTGQTITIGEDGLTISNKDKKSQLNEEGLKIGENGPSVTDKGINAGGMNISNVAPPTQPHHASTKGYVDTQVKYLENKINERYKDGLGASAMAMATSGLMPPSPGKSSFAVASAVVAGQPAFAMGITTITENGKLIFKGAVASDARGQVGGLFGAAYLW